MWPIDGHAAGGSDVSPRLDDLDRALLAALTVDGRRPVAGLAAHLGVARSTVQQRLARLEATGVVAGYTVVLGQPVEPAVHAQVGVRCDGRRVASIVATIAAMADVRDIWTTSGDTDVLVVLVCDTSVALDERIDRIAEVAGVRGTTTTLLLAHKFTDAARGDTHA